MAHDPGPLPRRSGLFLAPHRSLRPPGAPPAGGTMAAPGQRIHPAGSRHPDPRHAATPPAEALDATREHDACGVGFVAHASGARSHEVVSMALEAVARVAHRGAASTDNSGDGAGLLTQIPHRLFYRDAYRLGLHLQPGLPFGVGDFFFPPEPPALGRGVGPLAAGRRAGRPWHSPRPCSPRTVSPFSAGVTCPPTPPPSGRRPWRHAR